MNNEIKTTNESSERLTLDDLAAKVRDAFRAYHELNVHNMDRDRNLLVAILDAIEDDLRDHLANTKNGDDLAEPYSDRATLLAMIGDDPEKCFDAGRGAYAFNPFHRDNRMNNFCDSAEYIALDGYGHLCGIRDREYLACWYAPNISDYLGGNYGEPDEDTLQALAEVFGADYDNGETEND